MQAQPLPVCTVARTVVPRERSPLLIAGESQKAKQSHPIMPQGSDGLGRHE